MENSRQSSLFPWCNLTVMGSILIDRTHLTPFAPVLLIMLLNTLTFSYIVKANRVRSGLRGDTKDESSADQEVENKIMSITLKLAKSGRLYVSSVYTS